MRAWWEGLSSRDQLIVMALSVVAMVLLFYVLALKPLGDTRAELRESTRAKQANLVWMRAAALELQQLRRKQPAAANTSNRSLLSVVDASAKRAGLRKPIERMEPDGDTAVKLSINDAEFDKLIRWLADLQRSQGVNVDRATFNKAEGNGLVDIRLTLNRS